MTKRRGCDPTAGRRAAQIEALGAASSALRRLGMADIDLARRRARTAGMARRRLPRRDGLYGPPRPAPRAARRAGARHAERGDGRAWTMRRTTPAGASRPGRRWPTASAPTSRAMRWAAITTRCVRAGCSGSPSGSTAEVGPFGYRVFCDSAPVMEVELARSAGLGWRGKHTLLLDRATPARCSSWARCTPTCRCRPTRRSSDHCGTLRALHRRLPDRRDRRALPARCAPLHLLPHDRAEGRDPASRCGR